jgi:hypothetical protein
VCIDNREGGEIGNACTAPTVQYNITIALCGIVPPYTLTTTKCGMTAWETKSNNKRRF